MISAWLLVQLAVALVLVASWVVLRLVPTRAVVLHRALLLALPLAAIGALGPVEHRFSAPAQVWAPAEHDALAVPRVAVLSSLPATLPTALPWELALVVLAAFPALNAAVGLRRLLRGSLRMHRVRGVEVRLAPAAGTPFAVWLGRPVVVLDPDTAAEPALAMLAVRHELQHHRAGDTLFAWILLALGVVSPLALLLRRPFAEAEELECDRALLARGTPVLPYARALARIALRATPGPALAAGMTPFLPRRILMLQTPPVLSRLRSLGAFTTAALVLLLSVPLGWAADGLILDHRVAPAAFAARAEALEARGAFLGAAHPSVAQALDRLVATPEGRRWALLSLSGAESVRPAFEARLVAAGLPIELAAVPMVESGYRNRRADSLPATVPANQRGAGYWMFIAPTARAYGLEVSDTVDERLDPEKETLAAIALLGANYESYGDWGLALAAYNQGNRAVSRAIAAEGSRDSFVLTERGALNDYVAQVYAAAMVLEDPTLVR
ncbi:MAG: M56 and MltD domain-containing protein [Pseudomonadota bacterium]|nr:M56 and MltD domain-containing protein [Pseudomonadota bacterium]